MYSTRTKIETNILTSAYEADIYVENQSIQIVLTMKDGKFHTSNYPNTLRLLEQKAPKIFETDCFNEEGLCFYDEVKNTEIAHLLEHMILTNLKASQNALKSQDCCIYKGYTEWDWELKGTGVYEIYIEGNLLSVENAYTSITEALNLLNELIGATFASKKDMGTVVAAPIYTMAI